MGSACMLTVGYLMAVLTIRLAPISVTSPVRYSIIIFGASSAYLILGKLLQLTQFLAHCSLLPVVFSCSKEIDNLP